MAYMKEEDVKIGDVAAYLGVGVRALGPRRSALIKNGMIYSPAHGNIAFPCLCSQTI